MAQRRMFNHEIVCSEEFLDMPPSARDLYFQLGMRADDDGFVQPNMIMRTIGSTRDDLKVLIAKRFVLAFESGVIVIKHWLIHNMIRTDRYKETRFEQEKKSLFLKENKAYTDNSDNGVPLMATKWQPNGNQMAPQVRLGKVRLGKVSTNEVEQAQHSPLENQYIPTDDDGNPIKRKPKEPRNQSAYKLMGYYSQKAGERRGAKGDYGAATAGYTMLCRTLKSKPEAEVKTILDFYVDSEKFDEFPMLTAALSADSLRRYEERGKPQTVTKI